MKTTLTLSDFRSAFYRADRKDQFSYEALELLFDYFEQLERDSGEEMELDVIAICCEYSEQHWDEIAESYDIDITDMTGEPLSALEGNALVMAYLNDNTSIVGETDTTIVYAQF